MGAPKLLFRTPALQSAKTPIRMAWLSHPVAILRVRSRPLGLHEWKVGLETAKAD
jgi:hypothetical protein